jgi:radical SAM/Cys-rich protein
MPDIQSPLVATDFPALRRQGVETLQVNLGYRCNQSCRHCHVAAGPRRREQMAADTLDLLLGLLSGGRFRRIDLTGGAPELHPEFRRLVQAARAAGLEVIDRCNLSILEEPDQGDLAEFLARQGVRITASLPCYLEQNLDAQRGAGVHAKSIRALRRLNALGYGVPDSGLELELVYNPGGAFLPPAQEGLEADYRRELGARYGIRFTRLLVITNMPIRRFGRTLSARGEFSAYLQLLRDAFRPENLTGLMCRSLVSVDWRGRLYDCDFNQMLDLPLPVPGMQRPHLRDLAALELADTPIRVGEHCYGCAAGQGSSCGGALSPA